ncbi:YbaK/EbsC family protein [Candidatus Woesearchaeota archaeon]|nr:YbaK/EbsC family protein [Candidatus Woesearchaeota archaeon]
MKSFKFLEEKGIKFRKIELSEPPKSAQDVERLFGCPLHQVLKTLLFIGREGPVLVVVQGDKRVDLQKLEEITNVHGFRMAKPDEIKEITDYPVGGVCPFCIEKDIKKVLDEGVFDSETINIGSGTPTIGIELKSEDLKKIWNGIIADISQ